MKKFSYATCRRAERWLLCGLLLLLAGAIFGTLLGNIVTGSRLNSVSADPQSFSQMSANPNAAATPEGSGDLCQGCPNSYGVAARLRADQANRTNDAFRARGAVNPDAPASRVDDDYQYGGRFPEIPRPTSAPARPDRPDRLPDAGSGHKGGEAPVPPAPDFSAEAL